ncbi:ABC transporter substrate-binding protein [Paradesulfitobacterium aromaticivorans]
MDRKTRLYGSAAILVFLVGAYLFSMPVVKPRPQHLGILLANDTRLAKVEGLQQGLRRLGYLDAQDVVYQIFNAHDDISQLPELAQRLMRDQPDAVVAAGAVEAQALKDVTASLKKKVPVIFMGTLSPAATGLVTNPSRPEGNLTGLNNYHLELTPKRLELLHRLLPEVKRVAVLGDQRVPSFTQAQVSIQEVAREFSISLSTFTVAEPTDIDSVFAEMETSKIQAILLLPGFFLETSTKQIVELALKFKLPVFGVYPGDIEYGCLAAYGTSYRDQGLQSAQLVHKILRGQATADIPVETPDKIVLTVNLRTANELSIHPAPDVLTLADQVINP